MLSNYLSGIQNISYTNKDFESIYPELLDLVKLLTYKWDPSISNESDPGVILLKLNALIADKCNYNSDKNVLECFPLSVTQNQNARLLFELLGYYMHWYVGSTCNVSLKWLGNQSTYTYTIPAFTMVCDADSSVIYTLIGPSSGTTLNTFNVGSQNLQTDGSLISFKAIQGVAVDYTVNSSKLITANYLDSQRRLYFDTLDIAENGIFITNAGIQNYSSWVRKDNLSAQALGNTFYKFGLTADGSSCYIEFPQDIEDVIGNGIYITYIKTSGSQGNIAAKTLEKFYNDVVITLDDSTSVTLSSDNVYIVNPSAAVTGKDVETIDDAYSGYQKTVGTFDTLVTLRDYINYILTSGYVSNDFVCDRTNDVLSAYRIISDVDGITQYTNQVDTSTYTSSGTPLLSAFSLKLYPLTYVDQFTDYELFSKSFELLSSASAQTTALKSYIENLKCISHDYVDIQARNLNRSNFCFFKAKFPINCKIVTTYALKSEEITELKKSVKLALFNLLNASNISFGEAISYDVVSNAIEAADGRIKSVYLDSFDYSLVAVYWTGTEFVEIDLSKDIDDFDISYTHVSSSSTFYVDSVDRGKLEEKLGATTSSYYSSASFTYDGTNWKVGSTTVDLQNDYGIHVAGVSLQNDKFTILPSVAMQFKEEIYTKSVLAGVTLLYVSDEVFDYTFDQTIVGTEANSFVLSMSSNITSITFNPNALHNCPLTQFVTNRAFYFVYDGADWYVNGTLLYSSPSSGQYSLSDCGITAILTSGLVAGSYITIFTGCRTISDIEKISSNVTISFSNSSSTGSSQYLLRDNETLQFYAPNLLESASYSDYVKFEYILSSDINANQARMLQQGEYIIFYWKSSNDSYSLYQYAVYGQGNIVVPSFKLLSSGSSSSSAPIYSLKNKCRNIGTTYTILYADSETDGDMTTTQSTQVQSLSSDHILAGSNKIYVKFLNQISLDSSYSCYWILNNTDSTSQKYVLFEKNTSATTRILNVGEYFLYTDSTYSDLMILGAGTKITISNNTVEYSVPVVDSTVVLDTGVDALTDSWFNCPPGGTFLAEEQQYVNIAPGSTIKFTPSTSSMSNWSVVFNSSGATITPSSATLNDFSIQYKVPDSTVWVDLGQISVGSGTALGWQGRSLLGINTAPDLEQALLTNLSITLTDKDGSSLTISGYNFVNSKYPCCIKSVNALSFNGAENIDCTYLVDNVRNYLSLYEYGRYVSNKFTDVSYTADGSAVIHCDYAPGTVTKYFQFMLPDGDYIFKVTNGNTNISSAYLYLDTSATPTPLPFIYDTTGGNFSSPGTYHFKLHISGNASLGTTGYEHTLSLAVTFSSSVSGGANFKLSNPYKFTLPSIFQKFNDGGSMYEHMQKLLSKFDVNHKYDYSYQVDPEIEISNPLKADQFLDYDHIYNKFAIPQMVDFADDSIKVVGKL